MQNIAISFISYFLTSEFIDTFVAIVFAFLVDKISIRNITNVISSQEITEVSKTLFKYLLFSQINVLRFQL